MEVVVFTELTNITVSHYTAWLTKLKFFLMCWFNLLRFLKKGAAEILIQSVTFINGNRSLALLKVILKQYKYRFFSLE